jgi:hypothetical protein
MIPTNLIAPLLEFAILSKYKKEKKNIKDRERKKITKNPKHIFSLALVAQAYNLNY